MASMILSQLETFGPERCERLSYEQAAEYTRRLARSHYENFSVVSRLVPADLREHFANIYAFCRWADDLSDETGDTEKSLRLLSWWRKELHLCYADQPRHPVFVAMLPTIRKFDIPSQPLADLVSAFEQDQVVRRYQSWEQVLDYCTRSANPVGRLVLYLCGYRDDRRQRYSDQTCTALQLINFWQDVRRDILERDRIYVPLDTLKKQGLTHEQLVDHAHGRRRLTQEPYDRFRDCLKELVDRTEPMFMEGRKLWPLVRKDVQLPIRLFSLGGQTVLRRVRRIGYSTLDRRPKVGKATKLWLMARAVLGRWFSPPVMEDERV